MTEPYRADLLSQHHVIVTGGGTGLGAAMAARFCSLGAAVTICGRRRGPIDATAEELRAAGGRCEALPCDVRRSEKVEAFVDAAEERQGPVTRLVNNAAGNFLAFSHTLEDKGFDAVVDIVLKGGFHATRACGRRWIERKSGGGVLSITTTYAEVGSPYVLPSAMAKAGLVAMTRSLAIEWGPHQVRLNAISPGPIPTKGAWERLIPGEGMEQRLKDTVPLGRFATKQELASLATYLLSDELSGSVTGQVVDLDGGAKWTRGASFSELQSLGDEALAEAFAAMRPRKPKP
jgi:NAD(P)-dependent dehydrogenase (short-subunit alcohol dehydrogenase family)